MARLLRRGLIVWFVLLLGGMAGASSAFAQPVPPIVYIQPNLIGGSVFSINPDGTGDQPIPVDLLAPAFPVWSRDRSRIGASGTVAGGPATTNLFVFDPTGANLQQLTTLETVGQLDVLSKAFSPTGDRLVFSVIANQGPTFRGTDMALLVIEVDGTGQTTLAVRTLDGSGFPFFGVDWSPTAVPDLLIVPDVTIDFSSGFPLPVTALFAASAQSSRQVTFPRRNFVTTVDDLFPAFSPDGTQVAFVRNITNVLTGASASSIMAVNIDGTNERQVIAFLGEVVVGVSWSPDGQTLVFDRSQSLLNLGSRGLWTINLDGTGLQQIQPQPAITPSWRFTP